MLDQGGFSCVINNAGDIRCFSQRGVADLYQLYCCEPQYLRGAIIADKIVGKGAAALMVAGGVESLYTHTISQGANELLACHGIKVESGRVVDHIINRSRDGWCPIEKLCRDLDNTDEIIARIGEFLTVARDK